MIVNSKTIFLNHQWKCPICRSKDLYQVVLEEGLRGPVDFEIKLFYECGNCSIVFRDYKKFNKKVLNI